MRQVTSPILPLGYSRSDLHTKRVFLLLSCDWETCCWECRERDGAHLNLTDYFPSDNPSSSQLFWTELIQPINTLLSMQPLQSAASSTSKWAHVCSLTSCSQTPFRLEVRPKCFHLIDQLGKPRLNPLGGGFPKCFPQCGPNPVAKQPMEKQNFLLWDLCFAIKWNPKRGGHRDTHTQRAISSTFTFIHSLHKRNWQTNKSTVNLGTAASENVTSIPLHRICLSVQSNDSQRTFTLNKRPSFAFSEPLFADQQSETGLREQNRDRYICLQLFIPSILLLVAVFSLLLSKH